MQHQPTNVPIAMGHYPALTFALGSFSNALSSGIIGPLLVVYLLSIGLALPQIGILLAAQRIAIIACNVPTGILADRYGRRYATIISFGLLTVTSIGWFLTTSFPILLALSLLWGVAFTFQSGAKDALMIDLLDLRTDERRTYIFSRINIIGNVGLIVGGLVASVLAIVSLRSIWLVNAGLQIFLFSLFIRLPESGLHKAGSDDRRPNLLDVLRQAFHAFHHSWRSPALLILLGITLLIAIATASFSVAYPVFFKQTLHLLDYQFGLLGSVAATIGIVSMWIGERIAKRSGLPLALTIAAVLSAASLILFGWSRSPALALTMFLIIESLIYLWYPLFQSYLNAFLPDDIRATLLSVSTTASLVGLAIGELAAGFLFPKIHLPLLMLAVSVPLLIIPVGIARLRVLASHNDGELGK